MSTIPAPETQRTDSQSPSGVGESHQAMQTARRLTWLMFALCLIVTGTAAVYESAGFAPAALIGAAGLLSMLGWQAAETKYRPVPVSFIVPYSLVIMSLLVQNAEEFAFRSMDSSVFSSVPGFALYSIGAASLFMLGGCCAGCASSARCLVGMVGLHMGGCAKSGALCVSLIFRQPLFLYARSGCRLDSAARRTVRSDSAHSGSPPFFDTYPRRREIQCPVKKLFTP
ncbi:hypothetical protein [Saccharibacillus qingshengii]|uniref:hypothetical protein n=1 Tax=Saccharibacillus qingshengii TaxID=1763540 RepID=UPI00155673CF|nr:hypothetical protein [Saccharibacillus qingshengii]